MTVPFNKNRYGSQKEAFTGASVLAMDPGSALPEVSCQVTEVLTGTCSSKIPAKIVFVSMRTNRGLLLWSRRCQVLFDRIVGNVVK